MTSTPPSAQTSTPTSALPLTSTVTTVQAGGRSWAGLLATLLDRRDLTGVDTAWAMDQVVRGEATTAQVAAFLTALRAKGETAAEIRGLADSLRGHATKVTIAGTFADIVGTGGDRTGAVNISTMAAVVAAATGVTVVKHGGRAASSSTGGSADVLEQLGVPLDTTPEQAARTAAEAGIAFLFAPRFNPGLRGVAAVRRELAVPTAFNVLGPLVNPAGPRHQVVGVADARMAPVVAGVLAARGGSALVVRGQDGLDKLTTTTTSRVWVVRDGTVTTTTFDPAGLGLPRAEPGALRGGAAAGNADVVRALLGGRRGPIRDVVLLNAAAVLVALDPSPESLAERLAAAMARCAEAVDSGGAAATLDRWIAAAHRVMGPPAG
ncbi:anthranilate phosphoribosyltransferase 1 [Planotetraspora thailandica]|uniref:Anthranilate phosphoribosyltransferase n=1 Tax=Planotetraspora thailandica TaxID=487172 RepID=A0A8J3Y112_9ACTN|nr:anthranilate phosphoribosyltransferase [Planotetraspora thailandica]GII58780.1 anthranilate phosphoribosyltransferase 1 [Planotetraspora thailandica]